MTGAGPHVAVCIPAHGDPGGLGEVLAAVAGTTYTGRVTTVVALDGPDVALESVARSAGALVAVLPKNRGSYAARNAAIDITPADAVIVLFTDTDCRPRPDWVTGHVRALADVEASGGAVHVTTRVPPTAPEWVDAHRHLRQQHFVESVGFAATCNLGVHANIARQVRFDESLRSGGDFDFGRRLAAAGARLTYSPGAVVEHSARSSTAAVLRKVLRVARGAAEQSRRGNPAAERRALDRSSAAEAARKAGLERGRVWFLHVAAVELLCRAVYAAVVPEVALARARRVLRAR